MEKSESHNIHIEEYKALRAEVDNRTTASIGLITFCVATLGTGLSLATTSLDVLAAVAAVESFLGIVWTRNYLSIQRIGEYLRTRLAVSIRNGSPDYFGWEDFAKESARERRETRTGTASNSCPAGEQTTTGERGGRSPGSRSTDTKSWHSPFPLFLILIVAAVPLALILAFVALVATGPEARSGSSIARYVASAVVFAIYCLAAMQVRVAQGEMQAIRANIAAASAAVSRTANFILYCARWEETVAFFRDGLGLPVTMANDWFVEFALSAGARLSVADERRSSIKSCAGTGVTVALEVAEIAGAWEAAQAKGLGPTEIREHPWSARVFHLFDPEGHRVEVWQRR